ncbi:MAG: type III-B CRISPR module RAMP protein Cmr1 [bacterium]|nr:type III-B CRISPR module RAMP protein Cmr1 [bacterium]
MSINRFTLKLISPAFIAGSDKNFPEMRASSVRGQLRYWLRAILGTQNPSLKYVWDEEEKIFGSTNMGSAVAVRVYGDNSKTEKVAMLPHRDKGNQSFQPALHPDKTPKYELELVTRPGAKIPPKALGALYVWSLLGGLGRRSRRMFGGIDLIPVDNIPVWWNIPQNGDDLANTIKTILELLQSDSYQYKSNEIPPFPTLHSQHSWVLVGKIPQGDKIPYDNYDDAIKDLFKKLLRIDEFRDNPVFGWAKSNSRRASPLIAQLRRIKNNYYPVLTAIRSHPSDTIKWDVMSAFMNKAKDVFGGEFVWGGW